MFSRAIVALMQVITFLYPNFYCSIKILFQIHILNATFLSQFVAQREKPPRGKVVLRLTEQIEHGDLKVLFWSDNELSLCKRVMERKKTTDSIFLQIRKGSSTYPLDGVDCIGKRLPTIQNFIVVLH